MRVFLLNCLLIILFPSFNFFAQEKSFVIDSFESLKKLMTGKKIIEINIRNSPDQDFHKIKGEAVFSEINDGHQLQEKFKLPGQSGGMLTGTSILNYSKHYDRYEYFQADPFGKSTILLNGNFHDGVLKFKPINNFEQCGIENIESLEWNYVFHNDGSFTKEIYMMHGDEKFLHSTYTYIEE